ncbi:MAG TPA: hypothetical protein VG125_19975, partial [Pirellulales bacterium]|nr:hypothetical protein [Pirellulales bacterium]
NNQVEAISGTGAIVFGDFSNSLFTGSSATITLGSGVTVSGKGGLIGGNGTFINNGTINANVSGGTISITPPTFTNNGTVEASGGGTTTVNPSTFTNFASGTLTGGTWQSVGGVLRLKSTSSITTNAATIILDGATSHFYNATSGTTEAVAGLATNASGGSLTIQNGYNLTTTASTLTNAGAVTIGASSTLAGPVGFNYTQSAGSMTLAGGTLDPDTIQINGGTLSGSGTIVGDVINAATFTPGGDGSIGTVNIQGSYEQTSAGTLKLDVGGTTSGTYDQVKATGGATLGGTLDVNLVNGFVPTRGSTLVTQVMTFTSRSGDFATKTTTGSSTVGFATHYTPSQLDLFATPPGTTDYWLGGNVDFNTPAHWSTGAVPGPSDVAYIGPGNIVTFTSGDTSQMTALYADGTLNVTGGTLSIGSPTGSSNLNLTGGGTLGGTGTVNDSGTASWSGGAMTESGTTNFDGTTTISGSPIIASGHTIGGTGATTFATGTLGVAAGGATVDFVAGAFDWTGGTINASFGTLTNASTGFMTLSGTGNLFLVGTLDNAGTITQVAASSANTLFFDSGAALNNSGLYDVQENGTALNTNGGAGWAFNNLAGGTLRKSGPATSGTATVAVPFSNAGTVSVTSGTLAIPSDATDISGGTLTGGAWSVAGTGALSLDSGAAVTTIGVPASVILDGSSASFASLAGLATNDGSFTIQNGYNLTTTAGTFSNAGAVTIGTSSTLAGPSGFSYVQSGASSSTTLAGGTLDPAMQANSIQINAGTLTGYGTIVGNVTNSGTVAPGILPNNFNINLTITGSYTQTASGTLAIELGGYQLAGSYSQLVVQNAATLGGTLSVTTVNGFTPTVGQFFTAITYASVTGDFATKNTRLASGDLLATFFVPAQTSPAILPASLDLAFVPESSTIYWTGAAGDNQWTTPGNWSTNAVPTGTDSVLINDPVPGTTVNVASGAHALAGSLNLSNNLTIIGSSSLTLEQASGVVLTGGSVALGDPSNASNWGGLFFNGGNVSAQFVNITFGASAQNQISLDPTGTGNSTLTLQANISGTSGVLTAGAASDTLINSAGYSIGLSNLTINASGAVINNGTIQATTSGIIDPGGTLTNHGSLNANGGTLTISPAAGITNLKNGVLTGGTWTAESGGTLDLAGANITTNDATITLNGNASALTNDVASDSAVAFMLNNDVLGTLNINSGATFTTNATTFFNAGTVNIDNGSSFIATASAFSYQQVSGKTSLNGGTLDPSTHVHGVTIDGGLLSGPGTITGNLTINEGTFAPGNGTTVTGNYTQNDGVLSLNLHRNGPTQYDQLTVNGTVTLGGTLDVLDEGSLSPPADGSLWTVIQLGISGSFAPGTDFAFKHTALANGASLATYYTNTTMTLGDVPAGTTDYWINRAGGDWETASNWSTGAVPTATDHVFIGVPLSPTITIASGETGVVAYLGLADDTLQVDGNVSATQFEMLSGTLSGSGSATLTGTGTISGGFFSTAHLTNNGTLTLSSSLTLNTTLVNTGTITQTGVVAFSSGGIDNQGVYHVAADGDVWATVAGTDKFLNEVGASLDKSAGTGTASLFTAIGATNLILDNQGSVLANSGTLDLSGASVAELSGATLTGGQWYATNATLTMGASITSNAGTIVLSGARASFPDIDGLSTNTGMLFLQSGAKLDLTGGLNNTGTVNLRDRQSILGVANSYTQNGGSTMLAGGTLTLTASGGIDIVHGTLSGSGMLVGNVTNRGTLSAGTSGTLNIIGSYTQPGGDTSGPGGSLDFTLDGTPAAGALPGVNYGQLAVTGAATIGGNVNVSLANGFSPSPGATFQPFLFGSSSGLSAALSLPAGFSSVVTNTSLLLFNGSAPTVYTVTTTSGDPTVTGSLG